MTNADVYMVAQKKKTGKMDAWKTDALLREIGLRVWDITVQSEDEDELDQPWSHLGVFSDDRREQSRWAVRRATEKWKDQINLLKASAMWTNVGEGSPTSTK